MYQWHQSSGELWRGDADGNNGTFVSKGYSGAGDGKNNPAFQRVRNVGPIPQGKWKISGPPVDTPSHGPFVLHLFPCPSTNTFGRDGFLIHGDSVRLPGTASEGCIILSRAIREQIWSSGDRDLQVIA